MNQYILTIDLGTTLIKLSLFNKALQPINTHYLNFDLERSLEFVELDAEQYWNTCKEGIKILFQKSRIEPRDVSLISLSSQAETLVVVDKNGIPLRKAISWLDNRSSYECMLLKNNFDINEGYRITGQPDIITTWPITKILWIKRNERDVFKNAYKYLLLKDYIIYKLTKKFVSEYTIYNFSYYFDMVKKNYWKKILDFVGISIEQLPQLKEPGEIVGNVVKDNLDGLKFSSNTHLCLGALDQMAGMIGVGNIRKGIISETTGTVIAICTMLDRPLINEYRIPCHYNAIKDTYTLLAVCESGGISLDWFKNNFYEDKDYNYINKEVEKIPSGSEGIVFLPYLTGVSSPEYNPKAKGVFYGLRLLHTRAHLARAIMEGIAYVIKKNLEYFEKLGISAGKIISLGGGSKSDIWNQIKADIFGRKVIVTKSEEPASLGAAILGAVSLGLYKDVEDAVKDSVEVKKVYSPSYKKVYDMNYKEFIKLYKNIEEEFWF
ncbi:MAG: hypothetical protein H5T85_04925 [Actinobacteria bacterium]|nr:hypothetical protein [Actinomycetota bacterium]